MEQFEGMHPNWKALATVHIPLKRFVPEGSDHSTDTRNEFTKRKENLKSTNDDDGYKIKKFYEEIVKEPQSVITKKEPVLIFQQDPKLDKVPFDKNKYFRYSIENNVDELQKLQYKNQNINYTDAYGWSALMMASCDGAIDSVRFLIKLGVDRDLKDKSGNTAYMLAEKNRQYEVMKLLSIKQWVEDESDKETDSDQSIIEPFFCRICQQNFKETTFKEHQTSMVHQFHKTSYSNLKLTRFNISSKNRGLKLMIKQGWDNESGLGPTKTGRLFPVKTVIRKQRTGIGITQNPAKVTHFKAFDLTATKSYPHKKTRNRNDIRREKQREWKRERRLRRELS